MSNQLSRKKTLPVRATGAVVTPRPLSRQERAGTDEGSGNQSEEVWVGEVIDGEVDDEIVDAQWAEVREPRSWQDRWSSAKGYFAGAAQRVRDEWARAKAEEHARLDGDNELDEQDRLRLLSEDIRLAGEKYMASLKASNVMVPGISETANVEKVSSLHNVYVQMMAASCLRPLQQGVNAASVLRVASAMSTMYLMSPMFRTTVGDYLEPIRQGVQDRIDAKTRSELSKAEGKATRLSSRWRRRFDEIQFRDRGYRQPFTARSAAMTEMALAEKSFMLAREPGADVAQIKESHEALVNRLYQQIDEDGLTREEVVQAGHVVMGERMRDDPRIQTMVSGFAHGGMRMSPPHEERIAGTDRTRKAWRGDFESYAGRKVDPTHVKRSEEGEKVFGGAFEVRFPEDTKSHREQMRKVMLETLSASAAAGDMHQFNQDMAGFTLGCVARTEGFDGEGMPDRVATRLFQSRTMLASMTTDGFSDEDQKEIFISAYGDAVEDLAQRYPEFADRWGQAHGDRWGQFSAYAMEHPAQAYAAWKSQMAAESDTPDTSKPEQGEAYDFQPS